MKDMGVEVKWVIPPALKCVRFERGISKGCNWILRPIEKHMGKRFASRIRSVRSLQGS